MLSGTFLIVVSCLNIPPRHCEGVSPKQSSISVCCLSGLLRAIALAMTWRNVEECGGMWRNVEECEGMWRHIVALCLHIPPRHCEGVSPKQSSIPLLSPSGLLRAIALAMTWRNVEECGDINNNYTLHNIIPRKIKQGGVCPLVIENNNSTTIV